MVKWFINLMATVKLAIPHLYSTSTTFSARHRRLPWWNPLRLEYLALLNVLFQKSPLELILYYERWISIVHDAIPKVYHEYLGLQINVQQGREKTLETDSCIKQRQKLILYRIGVKWCCRHPHEILVHRKAFRNHHVKVPKN